MLTFGIIVCALGAVIVVLSQLVGLSQRDPKRRQGILFTGGGAGLFVLALGMLTFGGLRATALLVLVVAVLSALRGVAQLLAARRYRAP